MSASDLVIAIVPVVSVAGMLFYLRREGRRIDAAQAERRAQRATAETPRKSAARALVSDGLRAKARASGVKEAMKQQERFRLHPEKALPRVENTL